MIDEHDRLPMSFATSGPSRNCGLAALATGERVSIEFLPWYLSNAIGQKYKHYIAAENLLCALVVMFVTAVVAAAVSPKP